MESLKPCCYIWMSEESWTRYIWQDWGLHNRHRNPLVKISVSLMVHQESLLVLDSDHSINFHWSLQALKESINRWIQFDPHEQPFLKQYTTYMYIVKEFAQLNFGRNHFSTFWSNLWTSPIPSYHLAHGMITYH